MLKLQSLGCGRRETSLVPHDVPCVCTAAPFMVVHVCDRKIMQSQNKDEGASIGEHSSQEVQVREAPTSLERSHHCGSRSTK